MSEATETLNQILVDITANRANLAAQLGQKKQEIEIGEAQLAKFDTLIATMQVTLDSPAILASIATQEAANATVSPTGAAPAANEAVANAAA